MYVEPWHSKIGWTVTDGPYEAEVFIFGGGNVAAPSRRWGVRVFKNDVVYRGARVHAADTPEQAVALTLRDGAPYDEDTQECENPPVLIPDETQGRLF